MGKMEGLGLLLFCCRPSGSPGTRRALLAGVLQRLVTSELRLLGFIGFRGFTGF